MCVILERPGVEGDTTGHFNHDHLMIIMNAYNKHFRRQRLTATLLLWALLARAAVFAADTHFLAPASPGVWGQAALGAPARVDPSTGAVAVAAALGRLASPQTLNRLGAMVASSLAPSAARQQDLQLLRARAGADVKVQFRPSSPTVMQIRGQALEPAASGLALATASGRDHRTALNFLEANRGLLGLEDPSREVELVSREVEESGQRHLRYTQTFQGLPVWPASLSVHLDSQGNVTLFDGAYVPTPTKVSIQLAISEAEAIERARASVPGGAHGEAKDTALVIYAPLAQEPRLAWRLGLAVDFAHVWTLVVDGRDGRVLSRNNQCLDANVQASGKDLGGIQRTFNVWSANGTFSMADTTKSMYDPAHDPVKDPKGVISIFDARDVTEAQLQTVYLVDSTSATTWLPDAVSALANFDATFDYYLVSGRKDIND